MKKFELVEDSEIQFDGHKLYRIRATAAFKAANGRVVNKGDVGGFVSKPENLADDAWVFDDAKVYGNARVRDNACIAGNARVYDNADVWEKAKVSGNAKIYDEAYVSGKAQVYGNAQVYDNAWVQDYALVYDDAQIYDDARVYSRAEVYGKAKVYDNAFVYNDAKVFGDDEVYGNTHVRNTRINNDHDDNKDKHHDDYDIYNSPSFLIVISFLLTTFMMLLLYAPLVIFIIITIIMIFLLGRYCYNKYFKDLSDGSVKPDEASVHDGNVDKAGNADVLSYDDAIKGNLVLLSELGDILTEINNKDVTVKFQEIIDISHKIIETVKQEPKLSSHNTIFFSHCLSTSVKFATKYKYIEKQGVTGENISKAKQLIEEKLLVIVNILKRQLDTLFLDTLTDLESDIAVLEQLHKKLGE